MKRANAIGPRNRVVRVADTLRFPVMQGISPLLLRSMADAEFARSACASTAGSVRLAVAEIGRLEGAETRYPGLFDELSTYIWQGEQFDPATQAAKANAEFAVFSRIAANHPPVGAAGFDAFDALLRKIHRGLGAGSDTYRRSSIQIAPDAAGNRIVFPHHSLCEGILKRLYLFLAEHGERYPALCATVAFAGIVHAHPFTDGNGRTARVLCNFVLATSGRSAHFVPIRDMYVLSRGGFLIKLRRAMYDGDWLSLQGFFSDALRLSDVLQRPPAG